MRITGHSTWIGLLAFSLVGLLMTCGYLVGYRAVFGESFLVALTVERVLALPWELLAGIGAVGVTCAFMANRLVAYAKGHRVKPVAIVGCALALFIAMHLSIYETFEPAELYSFAGFFVVSALLFKVESKAVAAMLFAVIVVVFYTLCAKELGERDGERAFKVDNRQIEFSLAQSERISHHTE